jgi:hypothetical protein
MQDTIYRHGLIRSVCFTHGVHGFRDERNCHWLIDILATRQATSGVRKGEASDPRFHDMQIWRLRPINDQDKPVDFDGNPTDDATAVVEAGSDIAENGEMIDCHDRQFIGFTDWDFEKNGEPKFYVSRTMVGDAMVKLILLPSEY